MHNAIILLEYSKARTTLKSILCCSGEKKASKKAQLWEWRRQTKQRSKWKLKKRVWSANKIPQGFTVTMRACCKFIIIIHFNNKLCVIIKFSFKKAFENVHEKCHPTYRSLKGVLCIDFKFKNMQCACQPRKKKLFVCNYQKHVLTSPFRSVWTWRE